MRTVLNVSTVDLQLTSMIYVDELESTDVIVEQCRVAMCPYPAPHSGIPSAAVPTRVAWHGLRICRLRIVSGTVHAVAVDAAGVEHGWVGRPDDTVRIVSRAEPEGGGGGEEGDPRIPRVGARPRATSPSSLPPHPAGEGC